MPNVSLPQKPQYASLDEKSGEFEISGCYPGYGTTIGNALRRVLLSSLEGAAATAVKIKGVTHEFSAIPGVAEDIVQIILNIKKIRFEMIGDEPIKIILKHKGEGKVAAGKFKCPTGIKIINSDQLIATATDKKTELEIELQVEKGLGYVPVEQQVREEKEIGVIAIDAIYTPVRRVNYEVENMRVGKRTDYNKITLEITTDGSITPQEAFKKAVKILIDQFSVLAGIEIAGEKEKPEEKRAVAGKKTEKEEPAEEGQDPLKIKVAELKSLSTRTLNVLETNKIAKIKDIVRMTEEELKNLEGMGERGIKEIKKSIGEFGLTLKQA